MQTTVLVKPEFEIMDVDIIRQFQTGRSGAKVYLAKKNGTIGVYKTNIKNARSVVDSSIKLPFDQPEIYEYNDNSIFMEYIDGIPLKQILKNPSSFVTNQIIDYILSYIEYSLSTTTNNNYDFSDIINRKISYLTNYVDISYFSQICHNRPNGVVHGDFTFDNLIYKNNKLYMIDISPTDFNSIYFDMNKFRQDLSGLWFVRNEKNKNAWKPTCDKIYNTIQLKYPDLFDDATYNLMISRIIPYCSGNEFDRQFILNCLI